VHERYPLFRSLAVEYLTKKVITPETKVQVKYSPSPDVTIFVKSETHPLSHPTLSQGVGLFVEQPIFE